VIRLLSCPRAAEQDTWSSRSNGMVVMVTISIEVFATEVVDTR
jgi:hypothetical protein